jgi:hypothetical protein
MQQCEASVTLTQHNLPLSQLSPSCCSQVSWSISASTSALRRCSISTTHIFSSQVSSHVEMKEFTVRLKWITWTMCPASTSFPLWYVMISTMLRQKFETNKHELQTILMFKMLIYESTNEIKPFVTEFVTLVTEFVMRATKSAIMCNYWYISRQGQFNMLPRQRINMEQ